MFLDVDMPRMDGITACEHLRAAPGTSSSTIVILTAATDDRVEARAGAAGADLFLTKPFSPLDLLRLVDRIGQRQWARRANASGRPARAGTARRGPARRRRAGAGGGP